VAVVKSYIVWDVTPFSPFKVDLRFGGTRHLPLQGQRTNEARNQSEAVSSRCRRHVPPKRQLTFCGLHGVMYQKMELLVLNDI
jgi:hypothetical protein